MINSYLLSLRISYVYLLILIVYFVLSFSYGAIARVILLFTAFASIAIIHLTIGVKAHVLKTDKTFFLMSLLWTVKLSVFFVVEVLHFLNFRKEIIVLDWIDLLLLLILLVITSFSFIVKKPFFYIKTESGADVVVGVISLMISGWTVIQLFYFFLDQIKM